MADEDPLLPSKGGDQEAIVVKPALGKSVRPRSAPGFGDGYRHALDRDQEDALDLLEYWRLLRRHQGTLLLSVGLGVLVAALFTLPQTPVYQAKTSLELLNLNQDFMNMKDVEQVADENGYDLLTDIQTQIKILQSDMLLDRVIGEMQVAGAEQLVASRISSWRRLLNLPEPTPMQRDDGALQMAKREVKVRSVGQTRIMEMTVDSTNPETAADFANRLARDYIEENVQSRWEMTQKTGDFLTKQIDDMRAQLERSEDLMQTYARQNGLVFTDEKTNVTEVRLKDLQDELSKAQSDRVQKQSRWEMALTAAPETLPDILNDPALRVYQEKLADLKREKAALEETFTPDYPQVKRLTAQSDAVQQSMALQQNDILKQIKNEYDSAMRREILLETDYRTQTSIVSDQSEKSIQYNILKREVDTNRQLYESMLQHVKEASVAGALRASNIRVIDPAKVPTAPYKPQLWLNSLLGLLGGAVLGIAYIATTEKADRMLQEPSDVILYMGLPELGVIPTGHCLKSSSANRLPVASDSWKPSGGSPLGLNNLVRVLPQCLELATWQAKPGPMAESFRAALTSILFAGRSEHRPNILVVTSPNSGDGKTTVATNLAIALAETGQTVLLIDADMRKPRIHTLFELDNKKGLSSILHDGHSAPQPAPDLDADSENADPDSGRQTAPDKEIEELFRPTPIPRLFVLTSGPSVPGPTNLLYAKHFPACLQKWAESFDMILLDTPPMLMIPDARLLGKMAQSVVLVVRAESTTRDAAVAACIRLKEDGIDILGTIMNDWNPKHSRGGYYGYYDGYYQTRYKVRGSENAETHNGNS